MDHLSHLTERERQRILHYISITPHKGGYEVPEVAEWIGKGQSTVWMWVSRKWIPYYDHGKTETGKKSMIRIPGDWVAKYLRGEVMPPKRGRPPKKKEDDK